MKLALQKPRGWAAIVFGETAVELTTTRPGDSTNVERQASVPTVEELQAFVKNKSKDKREQLVDRLLTDDAYVEAGSIHPR